MKLLFASLAATLLFPTAGKRPSGPAEIIVIRHGEKPADKENPHLSPEGIRRAEELVTFMTTDPGITKGGAPAVIYATRTTKDDDGQRTQETVAPLARALKLEVQTPYLGKEYRKLAKAVLKNPALVGKRILICWNHENLPQLAAALGVSPEPGKWKDRIYDRVWVISYRNGKASLSTTRYGHESR